MELYLTFLEPHRVRYMTTDGIVHDEYIEVKYEFTTIEGSIQLQSDIRTRDLVDWFDVDVVWSDTQRRTDSYGNIRGLGTIQRVKLWRDRYSTFHYLTFHANQQRRWKEYLLDDFDLELRQREDRHRRVQLGVRGARRGSASESVQGQRERRFSATSIFRRSNNNPSTNGNTASSSTQNALGIRYLGIQFSRNQNIQAGSDGTYPAPGTRHPAAPPQSFCCLPCPMLLCLGSALTSTKIIQGFSSSGTRRMSPMPNSRRRFRRTTSSCHRPILTDIKNEGHASSMAMRSLPLPLQNWWAVCRRWLNRRMMRIPTRLRESLFLAGTAVDETRQMGRNEEGGVLRSFCNRYPIVPACRFSALSSSMTTNCQTETSCEHPVPSWLAPNITRSGGDGDQQLR